MNELQATLEFSVELYKFYNVDLFQRGLYQVRCSLKVPPRYPVLIEIALPEHYGRTGGVSACLTGPGSGASRPFQILYRNEEIALHDTLLFRAHLLADYRRLRESLERLEFQLVVELWFSERVPAYDSDTTYVYQSAMQMVSSRTLHLHFAPTKGLHYHLPVLFDYFHLAAVTLTIHAVLLAVHQPYINTPRGAKPWLGANKFRANSQCSMARPIETIFGGGGFKCGGAGVKQEHVKCLHQAVCEILLESRESLTQTFNEYLILLPQWQQIKINDNEMVVRDKRLKKFHDVIKHLESDDDFVSRATTDIAQLCADNIQHWQRFLATMTDKQIIHQHLAKKHHHARVKRFSEAFFHTENAKHTATGCYDYQNYTTITELARRSKYMSLLPPLPVHCPALDGEPNAMPIIFEDTYVLERKRTKHALSAGLSEPNLLSQNACLCDDAVCESNVPPSHAVLGSLTFRGRHAVVRALTLPSTRHTKSLDHLQRDCCATTNCCEYAAPSVRSVTLPRPLSNVSQSYKLPLLPEPLVNRDEYADLFPQVIGSQRGCGEFDGLRDVPRGSPMFVRDTWLKSVDNILALHRGSDKANANRRNSLESSSSSNVSTPSVHKHLEQSLSYPHHLHTKTAPFRHVKSVTHVNSDPNIVSKLIGAESNKLQSPSKVSGSLSSLTSEQSDWISSRNSSPDVDKRPTKSLTVDDYRLLSSGYSSLNTHNPFLNGDNLQKQLESLLAYENGPDILTVIAGSDAGIFLTDNLHPYIRKECSHDIPTSKSIQFEAAIQPPQQFRDLEPPPLFRDPPRTNRVDVCESVCPMTCVNDNHVYEPIKTSKRSELTSKLQRSQSIHELSEKKAKIEHSPLKKLPPNEAHEAFVNARDDFKRQITFDGQFYSDLKQLAAPLPYFHISDEYRVFSPEGLHFIVCVHGLDGNSADLRLVKTYLELGLPGAHLEFLMSERNQGDTFSDFDTMTDRLVSEIFYQIETCNLNPTRISFVGHSLGNIIIRSVLTRPQMKPLLARLHTFLSLSAPHLGTLYNTSGLVNMGMWFMQKWKKSGSLLQLCMRDASDVRQTFLYKLSQRSMIHNFKNVLLCGSSQDRYVPLHSARLELCKAAMRDTSIVGQAYREMVHNIVTPMVARKDLTLVRYDVHHALPHTANALIGRAAHIAVLDSELFLEKFLVVAGLKYFR